MSVLCIVDSDASARYHNFCSEAAFILHIDTMLPWLHLLTVIYGILWHLGLSYMVCEPAFAAPIQEEDH